MKALEEVRAFEDDPKFLQECVDILIGLQRNSGKVAEILTILKYEKPLRFSIRHFALHPFRDVKSKFLNSLFKTC
jgi:hypothetical protein